MTDSQKIRIAFKVIRDHADETGYGQIVSDDLCKKIAKEIVQALDKASEQEENKEE